jgi:cysteine desulfurase
MTRVAYLDWNATAPIHPDAAAAMTAALALLGNASSVHRRGREARRALEAARSEVAALVGARPSEIIFTSGGTEANHLALNGVAGRRVLISALEHDSVRLAATAAEVVPATAEGVVDLAALERLLAADARPALVSLMLANNETGVIQPVAAAASIAHGANALLHCDAVQGAGRLALDHRVLGADLITLSAHKLGGPQGVGALFVAEHVPLAPRQTGGGQERGRRGGTENLPGIIGFGAACAVARRPSDGERVRRLRDGAEALLAAIAPDAPVYGRDAPRLDNTLAIGMPGVAASTQVMSLDLAGVMVSAGAACSSGKVRRSHVLEAMGVAPAAAESAIRISLGWTSSDADVEQLADAWGALYARTRASAA